MQGAGKAHQHRFGHVQGHGSDSGSEGHQARASREGDAQGEAGVAIAAGADGVGQQHAVEPAVDDAIARAQGDAAAGANEVGQFGVGFEVHRLGVGGGVAEALHHQIGREAQAGQLLHLIAGHGTGGVLGAHGGHQRFAAGAGPHALQAAGLADHLLGQGEALAGVGRGAGADEQITGAQAQLAAHLVGEGAANQQGNAAAGAHLIGDRAGLELEAGHDLAGLGLASRPLDRAGVGANRDHIARVQGRHIAFDRQGAGVFGGVEKDRRDLATQHHTATALVRHMGDVGAGVPKHGIDRRLARAARAHDIAHVGHGMALLLELADQLQAAGHAGFQHRHGVQGDVRAGGGVGGRREVVGVGFALHFEHGDGDLGGQLRLGGEPFSGGPAVHHLLGVGVGFGQLQHVVEGVVHQQSAAQARGGGAGDGRIAMGEQGDQGADVVAADHGGEQAHRLQGAHQGAGAAALGHGAQPGGLHIGGLIHPRRDAFAQQVQQHAVFAGGRRLQQLGEGMGLLHREGQGRHALGFPFQGSLAIGAEHAGGLHGARFTDPSIVLGRGADVWWRSLPKPLP